MQLIIFLTEVEQKKAATMEAKKCQLWKTKTTAAAAAAAAAAIVMQNTELFNDSRKRKNFGTLVVGAKYYGI